MENLILVNGQKTLPKSYIPDDLVQENKSKIWLKKEVCQNFNKMNLEIKALGLSQLILVSGYRSYDYQQQVFSRKVENLIEEGLDRIKAVEKAGKIVALPGTSEHQTGLAIDVTSLGLAQKEDPLIEDFENSSQGKWLELKAHNYGFILRYPKEKMSITHITYEPWHYRYVGIDHAKKIKKLGMCLEEYIAYLDNY